MTNQQTAFNKAAANVPPQAWFGVSAVFHYLGPSFAVLLFPAIGVLGVAWFRIASAAVIFAPFTRPWTVFLDADRNEWVLLIGLGVCLAVMNTAFYLALERLPMSLVAAMEFVGTIGVALYGLRTRRNAAALVLAVLGVVIIIDVKWSTDPLGLFWAVLNGAMFVGYIIFRQGGRRRGKWRGRPSRRSHVHRLRCADANWFYPGMAGVRDPRSGAGRHRGRHLLIGHSIYLRPDGHVSPAAVFFRIVTGTVACNRYNHRGDRAGSDPDPAGYSWCCTCDGWGGCPQTGRGCMTDKNAHWTDGVLLGCLGMLGFSGTLVATRVAVFDFSPLTITCARIVMAGVLGLAFLAFSGNLRLPDKRLLPSIVLMGLGLAVGFPFFLALALEDVPAVHGAVVTGLSPGLSPIIFVTRGGERPPAIFWLACIIGFAGVFYFAYDAGGGHLSVADGWLFLALLSVAIAYVEGGRVSGKLGGTTTLSWAYMVLLTPAALMVLVWSVADMNFQAVAVNSWVALVYLGVVSMFLASVFWYRGLAAGGVARIGQINLLLPLVALGWSALFLGEEIDKPQLSVR